MYRKNKHSLGRRSSQPKRLSSALPPEPEDKNKIISSARIPRPTGAVRSSSVERDVLLSSSKSRIPRSTSVERISGDDAYRKSELRARSTENLFTPVSVMKTPGPSSSRITSASVKKTLKKDARPLLDRGFQNMELSKIHQFLLGWNIMKTEQLREVRCPMTTKLFLQIMNSLLQKLFPTHVLTVSNYCEQIPTLMRKLKYPGIVTRSWLLSVNTPLTWPHVVGLLSWLTDLLRLTTSTLKYVIDDLLDNESINALNAYIKERYIEWSENDVEFNTMKDEQFFDNLVANSKETLTVQLTEIQKKVQMQQEVKRTQNPEELAAEEKIEKMKEKVQKGRSTSNELEEKIQKIQLFIEKNKSENCTLLKEKENMKKNIACCKDTKNINKNTNEELEKLQSEFISCKNIFEGQNIHLADFKNNCYADDLANARLQGTLEKLRLQRSAQLRECTFKNIDISQLHLSLNYECGDNSYVLAEFQKYLKETKQTEENILKDYTEKEKEYEVQINKIEERAKEYKEEDCQNTILLPQTQEVRNKKKNIFSNAKNEIKNRNEMHSKFTEKLIVSEENVQKEEFNSTQLKSERKSCEEMVKEKESKYRRNVERLQEELHKFAMQVCTSVKDA